MPEQRDAPRSGRDADDRSSVGAVRRRGCVGMERFGRAGEGFPCGFIRLAHGILGGDAFTNPFNTPDLGSLRRAMPRLAEGWAAGLG